MVTVSCSYIIDCDCTQIGSIRRMTCEFTLLDMFPAIPSDITELEMNRNNFHTLSNNTFISAPNLQVTLHLTFISIICIILYWSEEVKAWLMIKKFHIMFPLFDFQIVLFCSTFSATHLISPCIVVLCQFNSYRGYQNQTFWKSRFFCGGIV